MPHGIVGTGQSPRGSAAAVRGRAAMKQLLRALLHVRPEITLPSTTMAPDVCVSIDAGVCQRILPVAESSATMGLGCPAAAGAV